MRFFLVVAIYCSLFIYKNSVADDDISLSKHIELLRSNKEIKDSNFVPIFNFGGELNIKYSDNISTIKRKLSVVKNHKASNDYIITDKAFYQNLSRNNDVVFDYNIPENKIFFDNLNVIIKNNNKIFLDYDDIQSSKYTNYLPNQKNPSNFYTDKDYESIIDDLVEYNNYIDEKFKDNTSLFLNANLGFSLNINHNLLKQITSMVQLGIIENGNFIKNKISLYSIDNIAKYILFLGFRLHNESEINFQYGGISNKDLAHK
ncbi:MAG: hypothetical protein OEY79_03475, partial [Anaplasmataceae bacterium]|nr:hypothetical protein [Anaplasmataceae bacterium]